MAITVRKFNAQVRDETTGNMIPAGLLSSDALGAIDTAKTSAVSAIEAKGAETRATIPSDYTALSDNMTGLKNAVAQDTVLSDAYWRRKSLASATGSASDSTVRISTIDYIPKGFCFVYPKNGYAIGIYAWDNTDTYMGVWDGGAWVKTGVTWHTSEIAISSLPGDYNIKIIARSSAGTSVTITLAESSNIVFRLITDDSLSMSGVPADAKATGDDISELTNALNGADGLSYLNRVGIINSSGNWEGVASAAGRHICIPVNGGDTVNITQNGNVAGVYAFLTNDFDVTGQAASFCDGYNGRIVLNAGETTGNLTTPPDCKYIYLAAKNNSNVDQIPASVKINGVELTYNIRKKIDEIDNKSNDTADLLNNSIFSLKQAAKKESTDIWGVRKSFNRQFEKINFSDIPFLSAIDMQVYGDGYGFKHYIDLANYKNASSTTTEVSDQSQLSTAISGASSGDTIIINEGVYTSIAPTKSVNLIGRGTVVFVTTNTGNFTTTQTTGIYRTSSTFATSPANIYDVTHLDDGIIIPLIKQANINAVVANKGSWYRDSSNYIYIHLYEENIPTSKNVVISSSTGVPINCSNPTENATIYLENITIIGGANNVLYSDKTSYTNQKLIAKDCKFYCGQTKNNISLFGVKGYFQNCESAYSAKDGFNYHANTSSENPSGDNTGTLAYGLEIDCIGHDNGVDETSATPSDNGSTMHNGGAAVRIGGIYYNNKGGNVADTSVGTVSYNYGCYAFDSSAPADTNSADFWAQNGAQMYLYGCRSAGYSQYNLYAGTSAQIHAVNTEYTTISGNIVNS